MSTSRHRQTGVSLIELMISLTIGLVLLAGLTVVFVNSSKAQRVGQEAGQQNENARYAMDTLTTDLHLAGYYGEYSLYTDGSAPAPDPCLTGNAATLLGALGFPVQGFTAQQGATAIPTVYPDLSATTCGTALLPKKNLMPGSDILVIRHVDSTPLSVANGDMALQNEVYLQTNPLGAEIQFGNGQAITSSNKADGTAADLLDFDGVTAGPIQKYYVDIYFVAPCSVPKGGGSVCTGATDDQGNPIPTLKLLQLGLDASGNLNFNTTTISEGIQAMKLEYGIDNSPSTTNTVTNRIGDGEPDGYEPNSTTAVPADADYPNTVALRVFLISRNTAPTNGFSDSKTYQVASDTSFDFFSGASTGTGLTYGPYGDSYMRHGYTSDIRLINLAGRREIP